MEYDETIFPDSCTFIQTGTTHVPQELYKCHTCEFKDNQAICRICAKTCHVNHDVTRWPSCLCPDIDHANT